MKRLYLYGPPASGKSTLARTLSRKYSLPYADLDDVITKESGMPIPRIFADKGEAAFRKMESEALRCVEAPIVALGGGTLLDAQNRAFAENNGFVAVIDADPDAIARRIEASSGTRPLGNKLKERAAHYASFPHHIGEDTRIIFPCRLEGTVKVPASKSHLHRLLTARFLAGEPLSSLLSASEDECEDIIATRRCLAAIGEAVKNGAHEAVLDCGESGSTLRFLAPVAAALGLKASFIRRGRLAERPMMDFSQLKSGVNELPGNVSSQFATGLLFALPLLKGDSEIRFTSPLQSRGYVDMTLDVIRAFGIVVKETPHGFAIPGSQKYVLPADSADLEPEGDWSAATFWLAANALGHDIKVEGLKAPSRQPDSTVPVSLSLIKEGKMVDVSGAPDSYPALAVACRAIGSKTVFTGTERLRLKESDRLAAMEAVFASPTDVDSQNDHRIAMASAIFATTLDSPVLIHGAGSVAKSYPAFWTHLAALSSATKKPKIPPCAVAAEYGII